MKKKIAILGSTGSIGISTLQVIQKKKSEFSIKLLTGNNNYKKLITQAKNFKAKNVFIRNKIYLNKVKKGLKNTHTKVYGGNLSLTKIVTGKMDFTISAIVGIAGLEPTIDSIKFSKIVAIANKESIICGWDILSDLSKKYKTKLLPVDSEHFSIMELTKNLKDKDVEEIIITASGGPFLNFKNSKLKDIKPKEAVKHPNWSMGKKISIDSANLMNKVFEVIEACRMFNFDKNKYKVMIHPQSYVHSIVRFKNGLVKMILYDTDMKIPISNILYNQKNEVIRSKKINHVALNNLSFQSVNVKKFPSIKFINKCLNSGPSAPTIVNASNEVLVSLFLKNKIRFTDIANTVKKILNDKEFNKYAKRKAKSMKDIVITDNWARLKTLSMCVR